MGATGGRMNGEAQTQHEFEGHHNHCVHEIQKAVTEVKAEAVGSPQKQVAEIFDSFFGAEAAIFMTDDGPDPESVLKQSMSKLNDANRLELIVGNLLEGLKRGESLDALVARLRKLGLAPGETATQSSQATVHAKLDDVHVQQSDGGFLYRALGKARKIGITLWRMSVNAIKTIPSFVKLKPKPTFGFVGPIPTFSLTFELEPEGATLHELWELLSRGVA
jgi:hypothetical protein